MLWSPRKRLLSSRIKALSEEQRLLLAVACIDWSLSKLQGGFQTDRVETKLPLVNEAMSCLWILARRRRFDADELQRLYKAVEGTIPGDDDSDVLVPGWSDWLNAAAYALGCAMSKDTIKWATAAMEYAYIAIYDKEITSTLTTTITGPEGDEMERNNEACISAIEYQFTVLSRIENGESVRRSTRAN